MCWGLLKGLAGKPQQPYGVRNDAVAQMGESSYERSRTVRVLLANWFGFPSAAFSFFN